eukprot:5229701-Pyramimonas_sp.AAC.1
MCRCPGDERKTEVGGSRTAAVWCTRRGSLGGFFTLDGRGIFLRVAVPLIEGLRLVDGRGATIGCGTLVVGEEERCLNAPEGPGRCECRPRARSGCGGPTPPPRCAGEGRS